MYTYKTSGTCARQINFDIDNEGLVRNVSFVGGCNGNLKAIGILVDGMKAEKVIELLEGNQCGGRPTSCADQLTKALKERL